MQAIPYENTEQDVQVMDTSENNVFHTGHVLVLHDIRSAQNVGSLFRTADAVGISKIYLSSITPAPVDRFGRDRSDIAKTALGAEKSVPWEQYQDIDLLIQKYKDQGYKVIAIEQSKESVDYKKVNVKEKILFILGNEVGGLQREILDAVDIVVEIPMAGNKESLNVSVAGGVALFRILNK